MSHTNTSNPTNNISKTTDSSTLEDDRSGFNTSSNVGHSSIPVATNEHPHQQNPINTNTTSSVPHHDHSSHSHGGDHTKTFEGNQQEAGGLTKSGNQGSDRFEDQPGSARASDHRNISDPRDADTTLGAKGDSTFAHKNELAGGQGVSVGGGEGTGTNETLAGGVKGTGGMGKRDGENAMGGGGGMVGKIAEKLHMGHGNSKTE